MKALNTTFISSEPSESLLGERGMKEPYLKWIGDEGSVQVFLLRAKKVLLGRKSDADVVFDSRCVSRLHARVEKDQGDYFLVDLDSLRGSYVDGQRIERVKLTPGNRICLGHEEVPIWYHNEDSDPGEIPAVSKANPVPRRVPVSQSGDAHYSWDLETISTILESQYQWSQKFSAEATFEQILKSALEISDGQRGFILLKGDRSFEDVRGLDHDGRQLPRGEFRASFSVADEVAKEGAANPFSPSHPTESSSPISIRLG